MIDKTMMRRLMTQCGIETIVIDDAIMQLATAIFLAGAASVERRHMENDMSIVEELQEEAELCSIEGADDIANLLNRAAAEIKRL